MKGIDQLHISSPVSKGKETPLPLG